MASLSVSLRDIPPEGMRVTCAVSGEDLQLAEKDPWIKDVLALTADVHAGDADCWVEGELHGLLVHECVRCLEAFDIPAAISFQALYKDLERRVATGREGDQDEEDSDREAGDYYPMVKHHIELHDVLREHVILSAPMQPICSEKCRGLCQVCGKNLNMAVCACEEVKVKSPFAVLQDVLKPSRKPLAS